MQPRSGANACLPRLARCLVRSVMAEGDVGKGGGEEGGDVSDDTLKRLEAQFLRDLKLHGIPGIRKAFIRQQKSSLYNPASDTGYDQIEEWVLDTEGCNLLEVGGATRAGGRRAVLRVQCMQKLCTGRV